MAHARTDAATSPPGSRGVPDLADPGVPPGVDDPPGPLPPRPEVHRPALPPPSWVDRADLVRSRIARSPVPSLLALVVTLAVAGAAWWLLRPPAAPVEAVVPRATGAGPSPVAGSDATGRPVEVGEEGAVDAAGPAAEHEAGLRSEVVVQASGAVGRPGVYRLPADARVDDLVRAAGGLQPDADADRVNLAAPVADGERVWVPRVGQDGPPEIVAGTGTSRAPGGDPGSGTGSGAGGPVDLNAASAAELETLPGVGPATAAAIIGYRDQHGPFATVDGLLDVRGIGDAKLEQIRPLVTV